MCIFYIEKKESTISGKGKIQYLPISFWAYFFLISMMPVWLSSVLLIFLNMYGTEVMSMATAVVIPCYCAMNCRSLFRALTDKRIILNHMLRKEDVETLKIREGSPYLYVIYRKSGIVRTKRFRISDWRKKKDNPWVLDLKYMALRDMPNVCNNDSAKENELLYRKH